MFVAICFVVVDIFELLDLSLPSLLLVLSLGFDKGVILCFFGLPPTQALLCIPSKISFIFLKVPNLIVTGLDF
jgi:hypothetical protein